jgi:hypothetical protein
MGEMEVGDMMGEVGVEDMMGEDMMGEVDGIERPLK